MLIIKAPAKVNLILKVLGKRPDGYHDLFMVMEKLSLADNISLEEISSGVELEATGQGLDEGMAEGKNLAYRAAVAFKEATGEKRGVKIRLTKWIPVAAGLGGGSSDAAAVLKGLNQLWHKNWQPERLADLGAKLGADVPFFCFEGPAVAEGIGERITPLPALPKLFFLLINPGFSVSTPWVYEEYDRTYQSSPATSNQRNNKGKLELTRQSKDVSNAGPFDTAQGMLFKEFCEVTASLTNDLENVTIAAYPEIQKIKEFLLDQGAKGALMAGSGPTVFGVFESAKVRDRALDRIPKPHWKTFATDNFLIP